MAKFSNVKFVFIVVLVCLLSSMLSACGGGGTLDVTTPKVDSGKLIDSASAALRQVEPVLDEANKQIVKGIESMPRCVVGEGGAVDLNCDSK